MARIGVTYDQVAAAADGLMAEGANATLKAVRDKLGSGGMGTIHKHLALWQANRPKQVAPVVELPVGISRELNLWVTQASLAARAEAEEAALQAQSAAAELARAGELLEAEREDLLAQISVLTTERDKEQATAKARASEIERLMHDIERERKLAGEAQVDAAQARLKLEGQTELITELKQRTSTLVTSLEAEQAVKSTAQRDAAVLLVERDGARREADEERARFKVLLSQLEKAQQEVEGLRQSTAKVIEAERAATERERESAKVALVENATLKAQLVTADRMNLKAAE